MEAFEFGKCVEPAIEAEYPIDTTASHDGHVQGVTSRDPVDRVNDGPGDPDLGHPEPQHFVGERIEAPKCGVDGIRPSYRGVSVQDLLIDLHVRDETFASTYEPVHDLDGA